MIREYERLLIKQYWGAPKARADTRARIEGYAQVADALQSFLGAYDLDSAVGAQLDVLGRIVGMPRYAPAVVPKVHFGFATDPYARGFASRFDPSRIGAPFASRFDSGYTGLQLADPEYRTFIRARIAVNNGSALMASDTYTSLQQAIQLAFDGDAYVVDNQDMSLTLYVSPAVPEQTVQLVKSMGLLPKPQGVRYNVIAYASYLQAVLADGPLAYWPCSEAQGATTLADATGNGHTMLVHTTSEVSLGNAPLRTNGSGSLKVTTKTYGASCGDVFTVPNAFTLEGFVSLTNTADSTQFFAPDGSLRSPGNPGLYGGVDARSGINGKVENTHYFASLFPLTAGQVVHVAAVYNGATVLVYINGELTNTNSDSYDVVSSVNGLVLMGSVSYPSAYGVVGTGSDFAIYDKPLTAQQIAAHYAIA